MRYLKHTLFTAALVLSLVGCAQPQPYHKRIVLYRVVVHIVDKVEYPKAKEGHTYLGYANKLGEVWVIGSKVDGKVVPDYYVLGHEIAHLLHWKDEEVVNPDE